MPLIHNRYATGSSNDATWARWCSVTGTCFSEQIARSYTYNMMHVAVDACLRGDGVALLNTHFILDELEQGQLFLLSEVQLDALEAHWMFTAEQSLLRPEVAEFHSWMVAEAEAANRRGEELRPPST